MANHLCHEPAKLIVAEYGCPIFTHRYPDYTEHVKFVYSMMNTVISDDLVEEMCLIMVFDAIKNKINSIADIPNNTLDKIVSIIINGGGNVSKSKHDYISSHIEASQIESIELMAVELIENLDKTFNINVQTIIQQA